jgi:hypothetical protein
LSERTASQFWAEGAKASVDALPAGSSLAFNRAVVQDAFRATLDAVAVSRLGTGQSRQGCQGRGSE